MPAMLLPPPLFTPPLRHLRLRFDAFIYFSLIISFSALIPAAAAGVLSPLIRVMMALCAPYAIQRGDTWRS